MLAQELQSVLQNSGFAWECHGHPDIDLCQPDTLRQRIQQVQPSLIINAAGYTDVDQAESHPELAFALNRDGVQALAEQAHRFHIPLFHISTDFVFNGNSSRPFREDDPASPLGVYGRSKWEGEEAVRQCHAHHVILRTAWLYSVYGRNFLKTILYKIQKGQELRVVNDQWGCPTWAKNLASALVVIAEKIFIEKEACWGTYHFCGSGETTWYGLAQAIVQQAKGQVPFPEERLLPIRTVDYPTAAKRPAYSVLDCSKVHQVFGVGTPHWHDGVRQCVKELLACPDLLHAQS